MGVRIPQGAPTFLGAVSLDRDPLSLQERLTLTGIAVTSLLLRAVAYFRYRFDSDESQHLHVTWGWTAGLVQYRDYFDNHAPLFHLATAPLLSLLGERPDILLYMRAPMLLLWAAVLWQTWILASRFWSKSVAFGAVVLLAIYPPFFLKSLEYRTDNAWSTLCVLALVLLVGGRPRPDEAMPRARAASTNRMFATGFVIGLASCVSMKTPLVVFSFVVAWAATAFAVRQRVTVRRAAANTLAFVAGAVIAPAILAWFFISRGAWHALLYCVFTFNELIEKTHPHTHLLYYLYPVAMYLLFRYARHAGPPRGNDPAARTRFFLALFTAVYLITLSCFWILISQRDLLPLMPLGAIFAAAWLVRRIATPGRRSAAYAAVAAVCFGFLFHYTTRFTDGTATDIGLVNQALRLTRPGEPIMDLKGETIYRPRPSYYVFETITREAMRRGLLADTVAQSVIRADCHVVQANDSFFPPRSRAFLRKYFLDVGQLRAAGQWLTPDGNFAVGVPGDYLVLDARGPVAGVLDGVPLRGARHLEPGLHHFTAPAKGRLACLWAPAFARGFSPFHRQDRNF